MVEPILTNYIYRGCLGVKTGAVLANESDSESMLTCEHRFSEWSSSCLGEMDLKEFGVSAEDRYRTDFITSKVVLSFIDQIASDSNLFDRYQAAEIGFIYGTTTLNLEKYENIINGAESSSKSLSQFVNHEAQLGWFYEAVRRKFPIRGLMYGITNSCSSGAFAIVQAYEMVKSGIVKACIAGGFDLLNLATIKGFESLQILSSEKGKPLTGESNGINLGDGGGLVLVESNPDGTSADVRLVGARSYCDAYHMTQPYPEGKYMKKTMEGALKMGGLTPSQIDYLNAHGTGTQANDEAELTAIGELFSDKIDFESTKRWTGHTLAGSGALELCLSIDKMLQRRPGESSLVLNNSFGFGGSNLSMLVKING